MIGVPKSNSRYFALSPLKVCQILDCTDMRATTLQIVPQIREHRTDQPPVGVRIRDAILAFNVLQLEVQLEPNWLFAFKNLHQLAPFELAPFLDRYTERHEQSPELRALHTQIVWNLVHFDASTDHRRLSQLPYLNVPSGDLHAEVMFMLNWCTNSGQKPFSSPLEAVNSPTIRFTSGCQNQWRKTAFQYNVTFGTFVK